MGMQINNVQSYSMCVDIFVYVRRHFRCFSADQQCTECSHVVTHVFTFDTLLRRSTFYFCLIILTLLYPCLFELIYIYIYRLTNIYRDVITYKLL